MTKVTQHTWNGLTSLIIFAAFQVEFKIPPLNITTRKLEKEKKNLNELFNNVDIQNIKMQDVFKYNMR